MKTPILHQVLLTADGRAVWHTDQVHRDSVSEGRNLWMCRGICERRSVFTRYIVELMIIASIPVSFVEWIIITRQYEQELSICNTSP